MRTFFRQTAQAMIVKHIDRFPLLKLDQVIDWQPIEQYLNSQRTCYLRDHRGRPPPQQKNRPNQQIPPTKKQSGTRLTVPDCFQAHPPH